VLRAEVPNVPGKVLIVSRTTYQPSAHVAMHYHTSQIVFYILHGVMGVRDEGKEPVTLKAGDSLFIKPGTVLEHWNASTTEPLVFLEYVLVDQGQRSAVFVKWRPSRQSTLTRQDTSGCVGREILNIFNEVASIF